MRKWLKVKQCWVICKRFYHRCLTPVLNVFLNAIASNFIKMLQQKLSWKMLRNENKDVTILFGPWLSPILSMICFRYFWLMDLHCEKIVQIRSFFCPYFPAFGLNTEIYGVDLRIQSKYGKMRNTKMQNRKNPYLANLHAVLLNKSCI